jgi:hypothetical protein
MHAGFASELELRIWRENFVWRLRDAVRIQARGIEASKPGYWSSFGFLSGQFRVRRLQTVVA